MIHTENGGKRFSHPPDITDFRPQFFPGLVTFLSQRLLIFRSTGSSEKHIGKKEKKVHHRQKLRRGEWPNQARRERIREEQKEQYRRRKAMKTWLS